ncbi:MAG: transposase [Chloroflexales bacterium]|nr:transposase [Chloroflexales bacterium]
MKYEDIYLQDDAHPRAVRTGLGRFFSRSNDERPYMALNYATPAALYFGMTGAASPAARPHPNADASGGLS